MLDKADEIHHALDPSMKACAPSAHIELRNGVKLPRCGLGTFKAAGDEVVGAVSVALRAGIRHIDTAQIYKNEELVSEGIRASGVPRSEVFVTSKVSPYQQGTDKARAACEAMVSRLGGEYVDLALIHWPGASKTDASSPRNAALRLETWRVLEEGYRRGAFKAIGVSNYEAHHLAELLAAAEVAPMVNQFELHPRRQCRQLVQLCEQHGVAVVAYASLGCGDLLGHPTVIKVAQQLGWEPAQVLLRWGLQKGAAVIPKSVRPARIAGFAPGALLGPGSRIPDAQMRALDGMEDGHKYCWDASGIA
uniref:NADP-dependent oxidoreductase domain-containing protein n=1 Tax=Chlamydomonas leiostraca TaxID=1034604 RepID=A0A7S0RDB2_9CHLO|mmetsp:Transcript_19789/g.50233  ORF Transcript_19789/g.50233 Transcript_19789/m.50233 type:complete len:306 (+) Transcript_19789:109-1026(+)